MLTGSSGYSITLSGATISRVISLQQTGFTSSSASPQRTVGFYPTRFTISKRDVSREWLCRFCGTFPKITLGCR